jgi:hypothetical protein
MIFPSMNAMEITFLFELEASLSSQITSLLVPAYDYDGPFALYKCSTGKFMKRGRQESTKSVKGYVEDG